ncbi:hypothetical protein VKT23_009193 [Stygiomarasmius scandens]|uniref:DUF6533 domain-containing protein n=1 Tax=Marasmiellus scandens TaxID=2682957 RepID=A0ABR1JI16_9AGAR
MSPMPTEQDVSLMDEQRLEGYFHLVGLTFLYYDHILTFPMEVEYLWKHFRGAAKYMFFLNRYFSVTGNAIVTVALFSTSLTPAVSGNLG